MQSSMIRSVQAARHRAARLSPARSSIYRSVVKWRRTQNILHERNLSISSVLQTRLAFSSNNPQAKATSGQAGAGQSSNTRPTNPASSAPDSASINSSRATGSRTGSPDTASTRNAVSNPSQGGVAQQEEPQQSWENVRRDPNEPDEVKRAHVEKDGQKPLESADK